MEFGLAAFLLAFGRFIYTQYCVYPNGSTPPYQSVGSDQTSRSQEFLAEAESPLEWPRMHRTRGDRGGNLPVEYFKKWQIFESF